MAEKLRIESVSHAEIDPALLAKVFWSMSDEQQADFFEALAEEIDAHNASAKHQAYGYGESQWCALHHELRKRGGKALSMYLALSVFAFEFSQDHCGLQQKSPWA